MIKYSMPDGPLIPHIYNVVLQIMDIHKDWFRDDIEICSVYGSFNNVMWNGGRICIGKTTAGPDMDKIIREYNTRGIGVHFTYTNALIEKEHFGDYLSNLTLSYANESDLNGVVLNNLELEEYVRKHYPNLQILHSATALNCDPDYLANRVKEVDILNLPPDATHHLGHVLSKIDKSDMHKVQVMVAEYCQKNCPNRKKHYEIMSYSQVNLDYAPSKHFELNICKRYDPKIEKLDQYYGENDITNLQEIYGFERVKISGRLLDPHQLIHLLARFLLKRNPEAIMEFHHMMLSWIYTNPQVKQLIAKHTEL